MCDRASEAIAASLGFANVQRSTVTTLPSSVVRSTLLPSAGPSLARITFRGPVPMCRGRWSSPIITITCFLFVVCVFWHLQLQLSFSLDVAPSDDDIVTMLHGSGGQTGSGVITVGAIDTPVIVRIPGMRLCTCTLCLVFKNYAQEVRPVVLALSS